MPKRKHKPNEFESKLLGFLERRKGDVLDDELIGSFASYLWRKNVEYQLTLMRELITYDAQKAKNRGAHF